MPEDEVGGEPVSQEDKNSAPQSEGQPEENQGTGGEAESAQAPSPGEDAAGAEDEGDKSALSRDELDKLAESINGVTEEGGESAPGASTEDAAGMDQPPEAAEFDLPEISESAEEGAAQNLDLLMDVQLDVKIELGRTNMLVEDVLKLAKGSVVELDKLAGDPVDILVNNRLVAKGEIVILDDNFCVRIVEMLPKEDEEAE